MNINLELYRTFYYVAKNENISRAANELSISQPAVSKAIKTLEEQLNTDLFIRKRDGMELTEAGETFYKKIKEAMELISSAENDLKVITSMETGNINIGASKTILHEFLMPYIKGFHEKYPNVNIRIFTDGINDIIKKTSMGIVDVIFMNMIYDIPNDFTCIKMLDLHDCLVASKQFNYLKDKKMNKKDIESLPLLVLTKGTITRARLDDYCAKNNLEIHPQMEFGSNTLIKEFTQAGFGIGLLTEEHIKKEIESGDLFKLNYKLELDKKYLGMVWSNSNKSLVAKNFIKYIKNSISN